MLDWWVARIRWTRYGFAGQGLVEYALILLFVAAIVVSVVATFGTAVSDAFGQAKAVFP